MAEAQVSLSLEFNTKKKMIIFVNKEKHALDSMDDLLLSSHTLVFFEIPSFKTHATLMQNYPHLIE